MIKAMSDWEEEYDQEGRAIETVVQKAPVQQRFPCYDHPREKSNESIRFGGFRKVYGDAGGGYNNHQRGGSVNRTLAGDTERRGPRKDRSFDGENSDSSPTMTLSVENSLIGRIIGKIY